MVGKNFLKNETFVACGQGGLHSSGGLTHEGLIGLENHSGPSGFCWLSPKGAFLGAKVLV